MFGKTSLRSRSHLFVASISLASHLFHSQHISNEHSWAMDCDLMTQFIVKWPDFLSDHSIKKTIIF